MKICGKNVINHDMCPFLKSIKYFLVDARLFMVGKLDCGPRVLCSVIVVAILIIATDRCRKCHAGHGSE